MLYALATALVVTIAGFLWLLDRRDARERDERAQLLQRIQAPYAAITEHHAQQAQPDEPEERVMPLSDDEIAERKIAEREVRDLLGWMEAVENGDVPPNTRAPA